LEFFFIELPKFKAQNRAERKLHELWLRFLTEVNEQTTEIPAELLANADTREAVGYMERAAYTKEQLLTYDKWKINILTEQGLLEEAKAEGVAIGLEKGEAIGIEKERAESEKKRIAEKNEIALNLLKNGVSIDIVSASTGLSGEQVRELMQ
jgi:predicted transposase/invertase (TIGR01784 family)